MAGTVGRLARFESVAAYLCAKTRMGDFRDLIVYRKAFRLAMRIFEVSKGFPKEEMYSLTDQIRRSSRSVCAQMAEAYRRTSFPRHFFSKITDADAENSETMVWIDFARTCGYIDESTYQTLADLVKEVGALLGGVLRKSRSPK